MTEVLHKSCLYVGYINPEVKSGDGDSMSEKLMQYCAELTIPKYTIREEIREKVIKSISDKHKIIDASKVLAYTESIIKQTIIDNVSKEPKSVFEELSRILCGVDTEVKFGKLKGRIVTMFDAINYKENCYKLRTIFAEFIICMMSGNSCFACANELAKTIKELGITTQLKSQIHISCGKNNKVRICIDVGGE